MQSIAEQRATCSLLLNNEQLASHMKAISCLFDNIWNTLRQWIDL